MKLNSTIKKSIAVPLSAATLLVGIMTVSVAACSNNDVQTNSQQSSTVSIIENSTENKENSTEASEIGEKLKKGLVDILSSNKYYFTMIMPFAIEEQTVDMEMTMAKDGDNLYVNVDMGGAIGYATIKNSSGAYTLSPLQKTATKVDDTQADQLVNQSGVSEVFDTTGFELKASGKEEYKGKTYDYEVYITEDKSQMKFYFENDRLVYILSESNGEEQSVEIKKLTTDVDSSIFDIPAYYTIVESGNV